MSVPLPPIALEGHCSTIIDETLYVLSPGGFQSLALQKHAQWTNQTAGVSVTGPACVTTYPNGTSSPAELWVIGGTSDDSSYQGLQVYSFANEAWQTVDSAVPVMQGRMNHSAAYLEDSQSIVVYAGSQPDAPTWLSSETFVLSTQPPYNIQSFVSNNAPPANLPILQPWDTGSVVMVGGSVLNTQISIFSPQGGWQFLSTDLVTPLNPSARGTIIYGSDGSKVLEVYDANVSPNDVFQVVLLGANGAAAYTGETVGNSSSTSRRMKRDLTLSTWPPYSSKNAPTATRGDFSVNQDSNGLAVLVGGDSQTPVALFNQADNSWVNAGQFFGSKNQKPLKPKTTTTTSSTHPTTSQSLPTATSSPSPAATASAGGESNHDRTLRTLGIILGVLCGIAVVFIIVLLFLRWRKIKKRRKEGWLDEKNGQQMDFQDRGTPSFIQENGGGINHAQPAPTNTPYRVSKNGSHNSLGALAGKINKRLSNKRLTNGHAPSNSFDSTTRLVKGHNVDGMRNETMELTDIEKPPLVRKMTPRTERSDRPPTEQYGATLTVQDAHNTNDSRTNRNRSSGWSKYFATSTPTGPNGLSHLPSAYIKTTTMSDASHYSTDAGPAQHARIPSSTLAPALLDFRKTVDGQPVSHVTMGSPSLNDSRDNLATGQSAINEGQRGLIVDPTSRQSQSDSVSSYTRSATTSARTSEYYADSAAAPWSPTGMSFKDHLNSRPPSNPNITSAEPDRPRMPSRGKDTHSFFPGPGTSYRPAKSTRSKASHTSSEASKVPSGDYRDSNATMWPKFVPSAEYSQPKVSDGNDDDAVVGARSMWPAPPKGKPGVPAVPQAQVDGRGSNITLFPSAGEQPPSKLSDLTWVNLGSQTRL